MTNASPLLLILLVALAVLAVIGTLFMAFVKPRIATSVLLGGMLMFSSLGIPLERWHNRVIQTVWLPLQFQRSVIYTFFGLLAFVLMLSQLNKLAGKRLALAAVMLFVTGMYAAFLRLLVHEDLASGVISVTSAFITLTPLLLLPVILIDELQDVRILFRAILCVNCIWFMMCFVQFIFAPNKLTMGSDYRFIGLLGNPQHAAVLLAFFSVSCVWLLVTSSSMKYQILMAVLLSINVICLFWTASRTGLGLCVIGSFIVMYTRMKRLAILLPVVIVVYFGIGYVINTLGIDVNVNRLTSSENTRRIAWSELYQTGMSHLWVGAGTSGNERSENSILYGFASFGVLMLISLVFVLISTLALCFKLFLISRSWSKEYRCYADISIAMLVMYVAGAVFEGYMIARIHSSLWFFMVISGLAVACIRLNKERHQLRAFPVSS